MPTQQPLPIDLSPYQLPVINGWIRISEHRARGMVLRIYRHAAFDMWQVRMPSRHGYPYGWDCWMPDRLTCERFIADTFARRKQGMDIEESLWKWATKAEAA